MNITSKQNAFHAGLSCSIRSRFGLLHRKNRQGASATPRLRNARLSGNDSSPESAAPALPDKRAKGFPPCLAGIVFGCTRALVVSSARLLAADSSNSVRGVNRSFSSSTNNSRTNGSVTTLACWQFLKILCCTMNIYHIGEGGIAQIAALYDGVN